MKRTFYIKDIKEHRVAPLEIEDEKLRKLFSFYFSKAPTLGSNMAMNISEDRIAQNWQAFLEQVVGLKYLFLKPNDPFIKKLDEYNLDNDSIISRQTKAFICRLKTDEHDYACLLRHLRNGIAHNNVFLLNAGNRKYVYFEDYNNRKKQTAAILLSQTDLSILKKTITR